MAPIYLVSACTSGEEFVAAFRRYADKHGLFVPIASPFAIGRRGRFAVTLRDGGVMIEGEAEIVSAARTPSVLHGRVGMTLKFLEPDPASKTILGELEKARLSMRPPPPSVAPRPATIPAQPRPVPPAAQGRIDAVNALAECVAIGEAELIDALALAPPTASPPKAGPRFVVPTITPPAGVPAAAALPRTVMGMMPLRDAGPRSDRMSAVALPAPPTGPVPRVELEREPAIAMSRTGTRRGVAPAPAPAALPASLLPIGPSGPGSDTMTVPILRAASPTDIGGVLVDAAAAAEPTSPGAEPNAATVVEAPAREDGSARTQVHAGIPPREPSAAPRDPAAGQPAQLNPKSFANAPNVQTMQGAPPDMLQTLSSAPPDMQEIRATIATRLGVSPLHREGAAPAMRPAPPVVAAMRAPSAEVEIAEPTDLSLPPQQVPPGDPLIDVQTDPEIPRPARRTAVGVAVLSADPPAASRAYDGATGDLTIEDGSLAAADEPTGADLVLDGSATIESFDLPAGMIPATIDDAAPGPGDEPTPSEYWTIGAGGALAPSPRRSRPAIGGSRPNRATPGSSSASPIAAAAPASGPTQANGSGPAKTAVGRVVAPGAAPPSGDWLIALDPRAPDGWSEPFETVPAPQPTDEAPAAQPRPRRAMSRQDAMPALEPKVQVDPTLIEPLAALPADEGYAPRTSSTNLAMYGAGGLAATGMPSTPYGRQAPFGQASPFGPPSAPAYPLDPSYQMVPITTPRAVTAGDSGSRFADPRHPLPAPARRRRVIIVVASAIVAVVIGVVVLAVLTSKHDDRPAGTNGEPRDPAPAAPSHPAPAVPVHAPAGAALPASPADPVAGPAAIAAATTPVTAASATCYADVSSQPAGAEIVLGTGNVVGTTPQKLTLPCGARVALTIRKGRLVPASRAVMPTAEGAAVRVALTKPMVQVKVSSLPMGATITLNGKSLGVTPTTIRLAAFEPSTLTIAKDGYAADTQKVTPKASGVSLHATLKKLEGRAR